MLRPIHVLFRLVLFLVLLAFAAHAQQKTFQNPVLPSEGADPHITHHDGFYYMTYTTGADVKIRKARSLATLKDASPVTVWVPSGEACCHVWAPEFHLLDGENGKRWYIYYTAGPATCCAEQRMFVAESEGLDPMGPYTFKGQIRDPRNDFWAIDGSILQMNGKTYFVYSGTPQDLLPYEKPQYIYIAEMQNPWTLKTERVELSRPDSYWEMIGGPVNEGPVALYRDNKVFLVYSGSGCWTDDYSLGALVATAGSDPLKPESWTKLPQPILTRNDDGAAFGPGHNGFFKSPDGTEDWIIYHANPLPGQQCGGSRVARAQKVTWDENGNPMFGPAAPLDAELPLPSGDPGQE